MSTVNGNCTQGESGFTLIEILVAILVFLTGVAGIYALLSTGLSMQQDGVGMARASRRLEEVVQLLQQQRSAGELREDVPGAELSEGAFYRMTFVDGRDGDAGGPRLVEIRVAGSLKGLDHAEPFIHLLGSGPSMAGAVEAWRARRVSASGARPTLDGWPAGQENR